MLKRGILIVLLVVSISSVLALVGDFNSDNSVNFQDFVGFAQHYSEDVNDSNKIYDLNQDNLRIDFKDFLIFAENYGEGAPGVAKPTTGLIGDFNSDGCVDEKDLEFGDKEIKEWIEEVKKNEVRRKNFEYYKDKVYNNRLPGDLVYLNLALHSLIYEDVELWNRIWELNLKYNLKQESYEIIRGYQANIIWDEKDKAEFSKHLGDGCEIEGDVCATIVNQAEKNKCYIVVASKPAIADVTGLGVRYCNQIKDSNPENQEALKELCRNKLKLYLTKK